MGLRFSTAGLGTWPGYTHRGRPRFLFLRAQRPSGAPHLRDSSIGPNASSGARSSVSQRARPWSHAERPATELPAPGRTANVRSGAHCCLLYTSDAADDLTRVDLG